MAIQTTPFEAPYAYFLTFTTYGTWLHGDKRLSVNKYNNVIDKDRIPPNSIRVQQIYNSLKHEPFVLNATHRNVVLQAIKESAQRQNAYLLAAHVRSNHVHILLRAKERPEKVLQHIKSNASRHLNLALPKFKHQKYWSHHGSTRCVRTERGALPVMQYIIKEQGEMMACYYEPWFDEVSAFDYLDGSESKLF